MPNARKIEIVGSLTKKIEDAKSIYLTDFNGLTVGEAVDFRAKISENEGLEYRVYKNRLIKIAANNAGLEELTDYLVGPTGVLLSYDDPAVPAKIISDFMKDSENLKVKVCWFEGEILSAEKVSEIAALPSKNDLISKLMSGLQSPMRDLASVLAATMRDFVGVLQAVKDKKPEA